MSNLLTSKVSAERERIETFFEQYILKLHYIIYLRAAACKNRELHFSDHLVEFLIFHLKIPLD